MRGRDLISLSICKCRPVSLEHSIKHVSVFCVFVVSYDILKVGMVLLSRLREGVGGLFVSGPKLYDALLRDSLVSDWIGVYRSVNTRDGYLRWLNAVCVASRLSPRQLLGLEPDEARKIVMNVVQEYLKQDKIIAARQVQTVAKSFYEYHDRVIKFKRVDRIRRVRKKVAYEVIPSKEQIYAMAEAYNKYGKMRLRNRAIILCLFQSGVRVHCLLNWHIGMVRTQLYPEIKTPVCLKITNQVDTKLSGYGLPYYYTFLQAEAARALRGYLDYRISREGELHDDDYIIKPILRRSRKDRMGRIEVLGLVKSSAKRIDLDPRCVWTHTIRKSFRKVLNASSIDEDTKEALMGHRLPGSRDNYFDSHDLDEIARKYMTADFSASKKTEELQKDLEASKAEIERLRVDLALAHSGRRMLEEEMATQARMIAELQNEMRRLARDLKNLKEV